MVSTNSKNKINGDSIPRHRIKNQNSSQPPKRKAHPKQQNTSQTYKVDREITNEFHMQRDLQTIGIYDHEWYALHTSVNEIKSECSKFNIGPILDGFGIATAIPLAIDIYKIIDLKGSVSNDVVSECKFYGILMLIYLVSLTVRKICKPKWLTSYTRFDSDIKNLDNRMTEIEKRIGIPIKKEE